MTAARRTMFGWLRAKKAGSFLRTDTEKVLRNVVGLPADTQRSIAQTVLDEIFAAVAEIEKTPGPSSPERDDAMKIQLERAMANRHVAIMGGATDDTAPDWAAAALVESWLMANTGKFGRSTSEVIDGLVGGWLRATLTDAEIAAAEHRATSKT